MNRIATAVTLLSATALAACAPGAAVTEIDNGQAPITGAVVKPTAAELALTDADTQREREALIGTPLNFMRRTSQAFGACMAGVAPYNASGARRNPEDNQASILTLPMANNEQFEAEASLLTQMARPDVLSVFSSNMIIDGPPSRNPRPLNNTEYNIHYRQLSNGDLAREVTPEHNEYVPNPEHRQSQWNGFGQTGLLNNPRMLAAADQCAMRAFGANAVVVQPSLRAYATKGSYGISLTIPIGNRRVLAKN